MECIVGVFIHTGDGNEEDGGLSVRGGTGNAGREGRQLRGECQHAPPLHLSGSHASSPQSSDDDGANADKAVLDLDRAVNTEDGTQVRRRRSLTSLIIVCRVLLLQWPWFVDTALLRRTQDLALAMKVKKRRSSLKFRSDT